MRTGHTASVGALTLAGCLACLGPVPAVRAQAAVASEAVSPERLQFDIRAQPLHEALQQYSTAAGRSLLYDSGSVAGLVSSALAGLYTPQEALRRLIAGTGMTARYTSSDAFMLVPMTPAQAQAASAEASAEAPAQDGAEALRRRYFGRLQAKVTEVLCADAATATGAIRLALRFRIDTANTLRQLEVHAEGHADVAARLGARLAGLDLGTAPPAQLRQPVTMLVVAGSGSAC